MKKILSSLLAIIVGCLCATAASPQGELLSKDRLASIGLSEKQLTYHKSPLALESFSKGLQKKANFRSANKEVMKATSTQSATFYFTASASEARTAQRTKTNQKDNKQKRTSRSRAI